MPLARHALRERVPSGGVKAIGVYTGLRALVVDDVRVLPWQEFLGELWAGRLITR